MDKMFKQLNLVFFFEHLAIYICIDGSPCWWDCDLWFSEKCMKVRGSSMEPQIAHRIKSPN